MLVNEYQSSSVESAKAKIEAKQKPDFTKTAPIIIWEETHNNTTSEVTTDDAMYIGTSYRFDSETGYYYLEDYGKLQYYTDISKEEYIAGNYYTCVGDKSWHPNHCTTMYKILSAEEYQNGETTSWQIKAYMYTQTEQESDKSDRGLYAIEDDYGTSYYYRGSVNNNYVSFAGFYWRIIRINGDGTIRLLYAGSSPNTDDLSIGTSAFNNQRNSPAYAGYMYGNIIDQSYEQNVTNEVDSTIKTRLDTWYEENIVDKNLESYIADSGFCNDRSLDSGNGVSTTAYTYFKGYRRYVNHTPSLICPQQNDLFTVNDADGNQDLTYPIGLITLDEMIFSGMSSGFLNRLVYTYSNSTFWLFTPLSYDASRKYIRIFNTARDGSVDNNSATYNISIRPVINLASNVEIESGIGTANDPYVVKVT